MIIPYTALSPDTLKGIIEEFVSREGTEYGVTDVSMSTKIEQVRRQLERGDIVLVYDEPSDTCDLVSKGSSRYRSISGQG
jgi:uncharacterized protein YheU (UPF0270 family)